MLSEEAYGHHVHETPHAVQVQLEANPENKVLHNHTEESVYNRSMTKTHLETHVEPVVPVWLDSVLFFPGLDSAHAPALD